MPMTTVFQSFAPALADASKLSASRHRDERYDTFHCAS